MTTTTKRPDAAAVSRKLRTLGFSPVAASDRNRQGLRVTNSYNRVRVVADLDSDREARGLADAVRLALVLAGYAVEPGLGAAFYVTGRAS